MEKRFFAQHQTMDGPNGTNATGWFDTLADAQAGADMIWRSDGRQEITDTETGAILVRGNNREWRPLNLRP